MPDSEGSGTFLDQTPSLAAEVKDSAADTGASNLQRWRAAGDLGLADRMPLAQFLAADPGPACCLRNKKNAARLQAAVKGA